MGQGVPFAFHFPAPIAEHMAHLCGANSVDHYRQIAAGGVFHANRQINAAGSEPVLLVFHGPCAHCHIGQHIRQIPMILRIQHFIRAGKARFLQHMYMQPANGHQPSQHVGAGVGIALMKHALVADAGGAGLIGINPWDDHNLVLHLFLNGAQTGDIIQHRVFPIRRAGTDHQQQLIAFSGEDGADCGVILRLLRLHGLREGIHVDYILRRGQFPFKFHIHLAISPFRSGLVEIAPTLRGEAHHGFHGFRIAVFQRIAQGGKMVQKQIHLADQLIPIP